MDAAAVNTSLDIDHLPQVDIHPPAQRDPQQHESESAELDWPTDVESGTTTTEPDAPALSEQQREMLAFEKQWWRFAGAKEQAIRDMFGISPTRYYQSLNALLDHPEAMRHDPALVKRLRRLRATRQRSRNRR
jgi:hypothetical protein